MEKMMTSKKRLSRRDFVKICGAAGLAALTPMGLIRLVEAGPAEDRFTQTRLKMGTFVTLTAVGASTAQAEDAFEAAWREMDRLIAVFDRHRTGTAVSELNVSGRLADPGPEMLEVLARAADVHKVSGGAFDPTVLPLLSLMAVGFAETGAPPDRDHLAQALELVDFDAVRFGRQGVKLTKAGQQISLDGVAKGYIVDRTGEALKKAGLQNALINAGGDILAIGHREKGRPWRVAVQDPFDANRHLTVLSLSDQAVATSGSYEIYYDQKKEYHHLINPASGRPAGRLVSATTITKDTAMADALATAVFVAPQTVGRLSNVEALTVAPNGRQSATAGFRTYQAG